jgi:hypothetical protein
MHPYNPQAETSDRPQGGFRRFGLGVTLVLLLPVVSYVGTVVWFSYDFPYLDDYPAIVDFVLRLRGASWPETGQLLLEQNNFHRVVWLKLLVWFGYGLTGQVDFRVLQWIGNSALLLTAWLLYRNQQQDMSRQSEPGNVLFFAPVVLLLFQFQGWNLAFWSMAAVSNLWAPAWALLAFGLAAHRRVGWALGVGVVATFTNGNGILVLPLLALACGFAGNWRASIGAAVVAGLVLAFYFTDYTNPAGPALQNLLTINKLTHLLALDTLFLGATLYHPAAPALAHLIGGLSIGWVVYLLLIRYNRTNPTLFWMLVFLHLTGLMAALNRIENPAEVMVASRYRNIPALLLSITYLTVFEQFRIRNWSHFRLVGWASVAVAAGIWLVSNVTYHSKITRFRELKQTDHVLWSRFGQVRGSSPIYAPAQRLTQLAQAGIFRPNTLLIHKLASRPATVSQATTQSATVVYRLDLDQGVQNYRVISGFAKISEQKANFNDVFLGVESGGKWQFYTTLFHQRLDNTNALAEKDTGFTAVLPANLAPANARLGLLVRSGGKTAFQRL